ncbi:KamA family radical SAM protein [Desulfosarcina ovata]|uniref:Lysine 2,3-aminomutase n=1 Tax=Desulfosarcina ovata subsp. ovata TaxID=2752305 RepID=A0A5K8AD22_9BACT|nr:KamA family radical SAM protein [Desulfosarcina ovata]BBO90388.1 lysine 2,3-aminomutase [Desulfosarcina ovata subsp. ovata]
MTESQSSSTPRWKALLAESVTTAEALAGRFDLSPEPLAAVIRTFPMRINPYYLSLIREPGDPIWRQAVPDAAELADAVGSADPLCEEACSPVPGLIHRYPDRVVLLASEQCAMFCRFCMRKRRVGTMAAKDRRAAAIDYIRRTPAVHEVVLSGGDPLMLADTDLARLLEQLRAIGHVRLLRIHSRMPCTLPQRVTDDLVRLLRDVQPLYFNIHFNHPLEITDRSRDACARLADAGIPLGSQTVLLKGVNDDAAVMHQLMETLLTLRVRPYYLHQLDRVCGTAHFRVPLEKGLAIIQHLRGRISGMGVPHYMIDLPGGGGKVPLTPEYVVAQHADHWILRNFENRPFRYSLH